MKLIENTFFKTLILGAIATVVGYIIPVIFVDMFNFKYYLIGGILMPIMFFIRYFLNKHWVFKK